MNVYWIFPKSPKEYVIYTPDSEPFTNAVASWYRREVRGYYHYSYAPVKKEDLPSLLDRIREYEGEVEIRDVTGVREPTAFLVKATRPKPGSVRTTVQYAVVGPERPGSLPCCWQWKPPCWGSAAVYKVGQTTTLSALPQLLAQITQEMRMVFTNDEWERALLALPTEIRPFTDEEWQSKYRDLIDQIAHLNRRVRALEDATAPGETVRRVL